MKISQYLIVNPEEIVLHDKILLDNLPSESVIPISTFKLENNSNGIIND